MSMYDIVVVGAGPAGLSAAIEARRYGASVLLFDENNLPGGQLFKQIHKFFGSDAHYAGTRGYLIGRNLLNEAETLGVDFKLGVRVWGMYPDGSVTATDGESSIRYFGKRIILATGASENALSFPGCTLPGVMTAGAVQTMVNVQHVLPGSRFVVVGSGNVGLIVAYQLLQAGAEVCCILEAAKDVGGYGVHAAKVRRAGVPILTGHTIVKATGGDGVESITIAQVDGCFRSIAGTEQTIACDAIAIAIGLSPRMELAGVCGCEMAYSPTLGGILPLHRDTMETTRNNILVAGDLAGIEEASTALDEGRMAGCSVAFQLGYLSASAYEEYKAILQKRLNLLRSGPYGDKRRTAKEALWNAIK